MPRIKLKIIKDAGTMLWLDKQKEFEENLALALKE